MGARHPSAARHPPGFGFATVDANPTTRAWLVTLEAEAHALAGNEAASLRALDQAETIVGGAGEEDAARRPRVAFFDRARLVGERGVALARLGRPADARQVLEAALGSLDPEMVKIRPRLIRPQHAAVATGRGSTATPCPDLELASPRINHHQAAEDEKWLLSGGQLGASRRAWRVWVTRVGNTRQRRGWMMGKYVQLGAVKTWYDEHGSGQPLVLLHGGLVDARWFEPNLAPLAERFHVYIPERRGHGHTPDVPGPITYQLMADDTIAFLDTVVGEAADLVGHSDGAFVAMLVAMQRPELVNRLVMISGGFNKSGDADPDMEWDVDQIAQFLGPAYGEVSPDGIDHFKVVATKIGEMAAVEPNLQASELAKVTQRALVMFSDDDLVTLTHTVEMYDALPNAELAVVPGTSHFLTQEKPHLVNAIVLDFLTNEPVPTIAGIRRAPAAQ
ncbi:MAG TPA: alpha/beta hydrolase [Actinomycetes bacterium]|nr:alpha/beta hydrolase [Actinomycetes bacterium]